MEEVDFIAEGGDSGCWGCIVTAVMCFGIKTWQEFPRDVIIRGVFVYTIDYTGKIFEKIETYGGEVQKVLLMAKKYRD